MLSGRPRPWSEAETSSEQARGPALPPPAALSSPGCAHTLAGMTTIPVAVLSLLGDGKTPKGPRTESYSAPYPPVPSKVPGIYGEFRSGWQNGSKLDPELLAPHKVRCRCERQAAL